VFVTASSALSIWFIVSVPGAVMGLYSLALGLLAATTLGLGARRRRLESAHWAGFRQAARDLGLEIAGHEIAGVIDERRVSVHGTVQRGTTGDQMTLNVTVDASRALPSSIALDETVATPLLPIPSYTRGRSEVRRLVRGGETPCAVQAGAGKLIVVHRGSDIPDATRVVAVVRLALKLVADLSLDDPRARALAVTARAEADPAIKKQRLLPLLDAFDAISDPDTRAAIIGTARDHPDPEVRLRVARCFEDAAEGAALSASIARQASDPELRRAAAAQLVELSGLDGARAVLLFQAEHDPDFAVRRDAVAGLARGPDRTVVLALARLLNLPDTRDLISGGAQPVSLAAHVAATLGAIADVAAEPALIEALSAAPAIRREAARALGVVGTERAIEPLRACLDGAPPSSELARIARASLGAISQARGLDAGRMSLASSGGRDAETGRSGRLSLGRAQGGELSPPDAAGSDASQRASDRPRFFGPL
jgi:HEAT repeat protein